MKQISNNNKICKLVARFLHWSMAFLIIINYIMGLTVHNASLFLIHEQIGLTILVLALVRIIWRLTLPRRSKTAPKKIFKAEALIAKGGQIILYILMVIIPLSGILTVDAKAYHPLTFWWLVTLPTLISQQTKVVTHLLVVWHIWLSHFMMAIIFVHSLMGLRCHYFIKDKLLARILPQKLLF